MLQIFEKQATQAICRGEAGVGSREGFEEQATRADRAILVVREGS